jgi:hypothetical protein
LPTSTRDQTHRTYASTITGPWRPELRNHINRNRLPAISEYESNGRQSQSMAEGLRAPKQVCTDAITSGPMPSAGCTSAATPGSLPQRLWHRHHTSPSTDSDSGHPDLSPNLARSLPTNPSLRNSSRTAPTLARKRSTLQYCAIPVTIGVEVEPRTARTMPPVAAPSADRPRRRVPTSGHVPAREPRLGDRLPTS